jgi:hypothetical protein
MYNRTVATPVSRNFMLPVLFIIFWHSAMMLASVPKTAIDEQREPFFAKYEIWFPLEFLVSAPSHNSV